MDKPLSMRVCRLLDAAGDSHHGAERPVPRGPRPCPCPPGLAGALGAWSPPDLPAFLGALAVVCDAPALLAFLPREAALAQEAQGLSFLFYFSGT